MPVRILLALALLACGNAFAQSVLNGGTHADAYIAPAIVATAGAGVVDSSIYVDYTATGINGSALITNAVTTGGAPYNSVASGAAVNHAQYGIVNASYAGYGAAADVAHYAQLYGDGVLFAQPLALQVNGALPSGTGPPVGYIVGSSPNSSNGGSGWGIELGLSASYLGLNTSEDSWVSAELAGFAAALKFEHPSWTWFDVKAALRQTASQWSTGWTSSGFGYGYVNWSAANALSGAGAGVMWLQPPGISLQPLGGAVRVQLLPFRQTRRAHEVIYSVSSSYSWPVKNEYTTSDLTASGGTLLYTSNGTDTTPTFTYVPTVSGTVTFVAFTTDGSGNYSRAEVFSDQSIALTVGNVCYNFH